MAKIDAIGALSWSIGGAILGAAGGFGGVPGMADAPHGALYGAIVGVVLASINLLVLSTIARVHAR